MKGEGGSREPAEAARWWRAAADQGLSQAQFNLGVLYEQGEGVAVDYAEAARWYGLAAAQGDRNAANRLANLKQRNLIPVANCAVSSASMTALPAKPLSCICWLPIYGATNMKTGRASFRDRGLTYVWISLVAVTFKKKN